MKYNSYLKSEYWIERKEEFKESTYQRCFICRKKHAKFNVHHKRYKRKGRSILFHERDTDFRLLCGDCHKKIHQYNLEKVLCQMPVKRIVHHYIMVECVICHKSTCSDACDRARRIKYQLKYRTEVVQVQG